MRTLEYTNIKNRIFYDFIACLVIIVSHFTNYIIYANYTRIFPDLVLVVGLLCVAAFILTALLQVPSSVFRAVIFAILITVVLSDAVFEFGVADVSIRLIAMTATLLVALGLVFFLREHTNKVLIGAFLAMLFSTFIIGNLESPARGSPVAAAPGSDGDALPIIVHLVLDEHMGLGGMTSRLPGGRSIRNELREFYARSGFRLFSHAYSQYFETSSSLASAMNFDVSGLTQKYLTERRYGFSLDRNEYLRIIADLNYRINIYQSNYFEFCKLKEVKIQKCTTYKPDYIDADEIKNSPLSERVLLIINMYYSSLAITKLTKLLEPPLNGWLSLRGVNLPRLGLWHGRVGPIAVAPTLDQMAKDISRATGGTLFFAHLLIPHYPYVYTPTCTVRSPFSSWSLRHLDDGTNTAASRRQRYIEYFDQVRCTVRKLELLFDAMKRNGSYKDAIIVLHGDHGSRINLAKPNAAEMSTMSIDDYIDGYSTLFALKAPGVPPGVDRRMLPLSQLLAYATTRDERSLSKPPRPTVYIANDESTYTGFSLPEFPALPD